jgi:activator of HSP90 ATPase
MRFARGMSAKMAVKNLKQQIRLPGPPHEAYEAIMDAERHGGFTHTKAQIDSKVGGEFEHYDGQLRGVVVDLEPDKRIVLAWRASGWPKGHFSIASFTFKKFRGGTKLTFEQYGVPTADYKDIANGWKQYYWKPLKAYLGPH